ncbi:hypothetical protein N7510_002684 [Penicillium lagena]|uniref:uncharacterized protein n=1 Tax=Penicillium lagena TaxID=94218 RepID=UPI002541B32C|nr:uncharacterized protein N7510_002684 [Penicillium lagena]KAJ5626375.1 hypothetical protein N7510_002684 [Penicillium lagena]
MADDDFPLREMIPPWGSLPIEQFLIKNWNHSSTDAASQQRQKLIQNFLELDEIAEADFSLDENPPRVPTPEEIDTILLPWRSDDDLRRKAYYMSKDNVVVFLRTYYNPGDDGKMNEWVHETDLFEDNPCWVCLNNPYLFDLGSDWQRVYEIMPEAAGPVAYTQRPAGSSGLRFKKTLHRTKQNSPHKWREDRVTEVSGGPLQNITIATYIVIADQEAFQTGRLRLLCLDDQRNIVREVRVDRNRHQITDFILHWDPFLQP